MHQPVRNLVIDLMIEGDRDKLEQLFGEDPFARIVYQEEKAFLLIEKHLNNELTEAENEEFKELLQEDPSLMDEINLRKKVNHLIGKLNFIDALDRAEKEAEKEELKEFIAIKHKAQRRQLRPAMKWIAAASVLLLIS
ncbi:MAG: hypothetical protein PVF73_01925, partial [Bacteroidales bacterium]